MEITVDRAIEILERTPRVMASLLGGIGDEWGMSNYGGGTFSPFDVLAHLVHGEQVDWIPRLNQVLAGEGDRPFEPYAIEEARAVGDGKPLNQLLEEFTDLRRANIERLRSVEPTSDQLEMTGVHPAFGPVTIANLLAAWAAHDLHHIAQVCKAMAFQLADEVGPWSQYMGIITQARQATNT